MVIIFTKFHEDWKKGGFFTNGQFLKVGPFFCSRSYLDLVLGIGLAMHILQNGGASNIVCFQKV